MKRVVGISAAIALLLAGCFEAAVRGLSLGRERYPPPPPLAEALRRSRSGVDSPAGPPYRILLIGDSMVRGNGVREGETIGDQLQVILETRRPELPWEVSNAGVGTGPDVGVRISRREVQFLREHGLALRPAVVLFGIYVGNDLEDHDDVPAVNPPGRGRGGFHGWVLSRWRGYSYLHDLLYEMGAERGWRKPLMSDFDSVAALSRNDPRGLDGLDHCLRTIAGGCREAEDAGVRCAAFIMPVQAQVDPGGSETVARWYGVTLDERTLREPNRLLTRGLADHGIPSCDLLDPFRAAAGRSRLFLKRDMHWTPEGHRLAAERLADFLETEGLIPPGPSGAAPGQ